MRSASETRFAHPAEQELGRLFDEHGIDGLYEPHTFVLEREPDGAVRRAFTPDFYLPDLDLYIECTVMPQTLTIRKRKKVRKTREQEGVTVEILCGCDLERLAGRWSLMRMKSAGAAKRTPSGILRDWNPR